LKNKKLLNNKFKSKTHLEYFHISSIKIGKEVSTSSLKMVIIIKEESQNPYRISFCQKPRLALLTKSHVSK